MGADEMFKLLVFESKRMLEILDEEIKNNGTNDYIEKLKKDLSEIHEEYGTLVLPVDGWAKANNKMTIAVYVTQYVCDVETLAKNIYKERRKSKTAQKIFNKAMDMRLRYARYIIEELE